jgi:nucleotide-binding universal stress UspA family protein
MYEKVLVPLDGSELAECVLPHVEAIVSRTGTARVILLRIVEPLPAGTPPAVDFAVVEGAGVKAAEEYLARMKSRLSKEGLNVETKVLLGKPAETITDFVRREKVDFVALATHGRGGISRWVFGSVADKLVRSLSVPMLLIRPEGSESGA